MLKIFLVLFFSPSKEELLKGISPAIRFLYLIARLVTNGEMFKFIIFCIFFIIGRFGLLAAGPVIGLYLKTNRSAVFALAALVPGYIC
jgi:hypothetical protein